MAWYACGPTVYEDAHLGHAKNHVSTDIFRRIMMDYFGFRVKLVMNTTDIDGKTSLKGRQNLLLERFEQEHATDDNSVSTSLLTEVEAAFRLYISKHLASLPTDTNPETFYEVVNKVYQENEKCEADTVTDLLLRAHSKTARSAVEALLAPGKLPVFFAKTKDVLLPHLDALHGADADCNNYETYPELTRKFERRLFEDMETLNVLPPDQLTRVTEYIPQIISCVENIVANGFG